jgi:hypothetical protein
MAARYHDGRLAIRKSDIRAAGTGSENATEKTVLGYPSELTLWDAATGRRIQLTYAFEQTFSGSGRAESQHTSAAH